RECARHPAGQSARRQAHADVPAARLARHAHRAAQGLPAQVERRPVRVGPGLAVRRDRSLFFFQAEDGIRDYKVTGVQTCALPISFIRTAITFIPEAFTNDAGVVISNSGRNPLPIEIAVRMKASGMKVIALTNLTQSRSEERRVG